MSPHVVASLLKQTIRDFEGSPLLSNEMLSIILDQSASQG